MKRFTWIAMALLAIACTLTLIGNGITSGVIAQTPAPFPTPAPPFLFEEKKEYIVHTNASLSTGIRFVVNKVHRNGWLEVTEGTNQKLLNSNNFFQAVDITSKSNSEKNDITLELRVRSSR